LNFPSADGAEFTEKNLGKALPLCITC